MICRMETTADFSILIAGGGFVLTVWWFFFTVAQRTWNRDSRAWKTIVNGIVAPIVFNAVAVAGLYQITG